MSDPSQYPEQQPPPGAMPPPPSAPPPPPPPPPSGYGTGGGYDQPAAYGAPTPGWSGPPLAEWPKRAQSYLIDYLGPAILAGFVQFAISDALGFLIWLGALGWGIYNGYLNGQTGQSYGMQQFKLRLLKEADGQPIGGGMGIARAFINIINSLPCYVGWLWPLWDPKKQTFTDKILSTVVIDEAA